MPAAVKPVSGSLLMREQAQQFHLVREALEESKGLPWPSKEAADALEQLTRVCLRVPEMLRDCWGWVRGQVQDASPSRRIEAGEAMRTVLGNWLELLDAVRAATQKPLDSEPAVPGTEELLAAGDELCAIGQEVNQLCPLDEVPPPGTKLNLPYAELAERARRNPPPPEWYGEDFGSF
jgi:hypothetical protein